MYNKTGSFPKVLSLCPVDVLDAQENNFHLEPRSNTCLTKGSAFFFYFLIFLGTCWASLEAQMVKNLPAIQETQV